MLNLRLNKMMNDEILKGYEKDVERINKMINDKSGQGNDYIGWADWPVNYDKEELARIKKDAQYVRDNFDILVVCGIGGSYLGARCALEALNGLKSDDKLEIIFMGQTFSPNYVAQVMDYLKGKNFAINVISKSGTTTETSISFRILKELLEKQVGKEKARKAIYATTDKEKGILHDIAVKNEYEMFVVPDNVGGRYSVLTAVGLLPMAVANIDIDDILDGALFASHVFNQRDISANDCYKYALIRNVLYQKGKAIEIMASYEPSFSYFIEWYKQLFGESEGKQHKGIFPAGVNFTTDLHSMGQFIQEGTRNIFETVINVEIDRTFIKFPEFKEDDDNLNYLAGKEIDYINKQAYKGTFDAHVSGGVPVIIINVEDLTEYNIGQLIFFFEKACAISGYMLGVNPFDQPGVEAYKKNMMNLLKK